MAFIILIQTAMQTCDHQYCQTSMYTLYIMVLLFMLKYVTGLSIRSGGPMIVHGVSSAA